MASAGSRAISRNSTAEDPQGAAAAIAGRPRVGQQPLQMDSVWHPVDLRRLVMPLKAHLKIHRQSELHDFIACEVSSSRADSHFFPPAAGDATVIQRGSPTASHPLATSPVSRKTHLERSSVFALFSYWHKGESVRHRSDSVRYVRYFCRADEATAMPLDDPEHHKPDVATPSVRSMPRRSS